MRSMKDVFKEAMRADKQAVEDFRRRAAKAKDRAEYYRAMLRVWRDDSSLISGKMMGYIREAAAQDGVELEEEAPEQATGEKRKNDRARWAVQYLWPRRE